MKLFKGGIWHVLALVAGVLGSLSASAAAPEAPTNLRSSWVDANTAVLTWDDMPAADSFKVYRFDATTQGWVAIGSNVAVTTFRDQPGAEPPLDYAVAAVNADG